MDRTIELVLVSAHGLIFAGEVQAFAAPGKLGELGIYPGHAALLTQLKPGEIRITTAAGELLMFYVSGGMLEVQPFGATVLADTALRAQDIDAAAARKARDRAKQVLKSAHSVIELEQARVELDQAIARIRAHEHLQRQRSRAGKHRQTFPTDPSDETAS